MNSDPILAAWGLFLSAFVSATLVPGSSEVLLAYLALNSPLSPSALLSIATAGNSLGAITTWGLGFLLSRGYPLERWAQQPSARALQWVQRWGVWSLLLSWLPVLGDALCLAAGWLRLPAMSSAVAIVVGKALRYGIVLAVALSAGEEPVF